MTGSQAPVVTAAKSPAMQAFMRLVLADRALQDRLGDCQTPDDYIKTALAIAAGHDVALRGDDMRDALRPDPLGLSRWDCAPVTCDGWPPADWLPLRSVPGTNRPSFDWGWLPDEALSQPFYEDAVRRWGPLPLNLMFRARTSLEAVVAGARDNPGSDPAGFIFHMSRCGSTLLARQLGAIPGHVVLSEPEPLDAIVQWAWRRGGRDELAVAALQAMIGALGRRCSSGGRCFFKLDSWHVMALPLFRRAFPQVPWLFLYRDPVEVMVSQMAMPGIHAVPGLLSSDLFGIEEGEATPGADYCATVLGRVCDAALRYLALGGGMLVNYDELADAAAGRITAHFGYQLDPGAMTSIRAVATRDSKHPDRAFQKDGEVKRASASQPLKTAVDAHLRPAFDRLERRRARNRERSAPGPRMALP